MVIPPSLGDSISIMEIYGMTSTIFAIPGIIKSSTRDWKNDFRESVPMKIDDHQKNKINFLIMAHMGLW